MHIAYYILCISLSVCARLDLLDFVCFLSMFYVCDVHNAYISLVVKKMFVFFLIFTEKSWNFSVHLPIKLNNRMDCWVMNSLENGIWLTKENWQTCNVHVNPNEMCVKSSVNINMPTNMYNVHVKREKKSNKKMT